MNSSAHISVTKIRTIDPSIQTCTLTLDQKMLLLFLSIAVHPKAATHPASDISSLSSLWGQARGTSVPEALSISPHSSRSELYRGILKRMMMMDYVPYN